MPIAPAMATALSYDTPPLAFLGDGTHLDNALATYPCIAFKHQRYHHTPRPLADTPRLSNGCPWKRLFASRHLATLWLISYRWACSNGAMARSELHGEANPVNIGFSAK